MRKPTCSRQNNYAPKMPHPWGILLSRILSRGIEFARGHLRITLAVRVVGFLLCPSLYSGKLTALSEWPRFNCCLDF